MQKIRVLIADDHELIREGFRSLLTSHDRIEIAGEAEDGLDLLEKVDTIKPDVVLIDITMPKLSGLEAMERLTKLHPQIRFIILTMHSEREYLMRALNTGAHGYLLKNITTAELERAIVTVFENGRYFSPAIANLLADSMTSSENVVTDISPREREVLELVADGLSTKLIADKLGISIRTVETHRINLLKKLKSSNSAELIRKSIGLGIITRL